MKRAFAVLGLLLTLCGVAPAAYFQAQTYLPAATPNPNLRQENFFGLTGSAWQNFNGTYTPGLGNPAVSTSDWYHLGVYWLRPYDLLDPNNNCGAAGATVAATPGKGRYAWLSGPDHSAGFPWADEQGIALGFSNDPGVPPQTMTVAIGPQFASSKSALAKVADITATISGTTLTATSVTGWFSFDNNAVVTGSGVTQALIVQQLTNTDTRPGGTGTYQISVSQSIPSPQSMVISQQNFGVFATPFLVCNPDDASFTFYLYGEGAADRVQNETGVLKSADLVTWQSPVPTHTVYSYGPYSSYMRVVRTGVNTWYSTGFAANFPQTIGSYGYNKWISTNGTIWTPNSGNFSACLPANATGPVGNQPCNAASATFNNEAGAPPRTTIGANDWSMGHTNTMVNSQRIGSQWVSRTPIDTNYNSIASPSAVLISSAYNGQFPSQNYVNEVAGYVEDGIAHYYAATGFPPSSTLGGTVDAAYFLNGGACNLTSATFEITNSSIAGTTLTVGTTPPYPLLANQQMWYGSDPAFQKAFIVQQLGGPAGGAGTYQVSVSQNNATGTIGITTCGGLWQQGKSWFSEIIDASAAATAAPVGVKASCASSVASLTWANALPQQTYRLYRGTSAGSQPTLVGDFSGTSATDSGMTLNAVTYYRLVYLHSGVEQKNRVVSTYCSASIYPEVNAHLTRASAGGADMTTCNRTFMDTFYLWLTSNGMKDNLLFASMPEFCVAKSGSNISKVFDMGTTRLPRGGDYTPLVPASTTYNATGINSKPAWVNSANTAYGYYGGGRFNNIRRKTQITLLAAYQKPGTAVLTPFALGQFSSLMSLSHTAGAPGGISCTAFDASHPATATATVAGLATDVHTASCTFDGTNWTAWSDATAGTPVGGLVIPSPNLNPPDMLTGQIDNGPNPNSNWFTLMSGTNFGMFNPTTGYTNSGNAALSSFRGLFVFDKAFSGAQQTSFDALVR